MAAFTFTVEDRIGTITFNRPDAMNTLDRSSAMKLAKLFDRTDIDDEIRALIVTGSGRAFCAGADLSSGVFGERSHSDGSPRDWGGVLTLRIFESVKPIIAAVNGVAAGVGVTLQLPMDVRIASTEARFGFVFTRRGIVPESASTWFLPRIVGISQALDWCYSGRVFDAQEALAGGLVRSLHQPDDLMDAARRLARTYVENTAPVSVALARRMMWRMLAADHPMQAHAIESSMIETRGQSEDAKEGVASFREKRPARFPDKVSSGLPPVGESREWAGSGR